MTTERKGTERMVKEGARETKDQEGGRVIELEEGEKTRKDDEDYKVA